jgi:hypothetical protein
MKIHLPDLPVHPTLRHPRTGAPLRAVGFTRSGRAMWPILGAAPDDPPSGDGGEGDTGGGDGDKADDQGDGLGDAGKQAIERMKVERNTARKELRDVKTQLEKLAPLQKLADALGGAPAGDDGKPDVDALAQRLSQHENELQYERLARFRAEVAHEKGLTATQAKRLAGATREELAADADELLKDFTPTAGGTNAGRRGLKPDPSQGSRGGRVASGREQALAEAERRYGKKTTT